MILRILEIRLRSLLQLISPFHHRGILLLLLNCSLIGTLIFLLRSFLIFECFFSSLCHSLDVNIYFFVDQLIYCHFIVSFSLFLLHHQSLCVGCPSPEKPSPDQGGRQGGEEEEGGGEEERGGGEEESAGGKEIGQRLRL